MKNKSKEKIDIIEVVFLPVLSDKIREAKELLAQAQEDWVNLYGDCDKEKVTKNPIFSVVEANVKVDIIDGLIADIDRMLKR